MLVPRSGIESMPPAQGAWSLPLNCQGNTSAKYGSSSDYVFSENPQLANCG